MRDEIGGLEAKDSRIRKIRKLNRPMVCHREVVLVRMSGKVF